MHKKISSRIRYTKNEMINMREPKLKPGRNNSWKVQDIFNTISIPLRYIYILNIHVTIPKMLTWYRMF